MKKKIIMIGGGILTVLVLCAAGLVFLKNSSMWNEIGLTLHEKRMERLFDKTIHDFPGHMIDNLDEQEDTNFIVYAEDVKRITSEADVNVVVSADQDQFVYVIDHPDEQIISLEKDDVFFIEPSEQCAAGIHAKVDEIHIESEQAVIQGTSYKMEELIEYADIDMDIPADEVYLDYSQMEEHEAASWLEDHEIDTSFPGDVSLSTGVKYNQGPINVQLDIGMSLQDIHIIYKVYPKRLTAYMGIACKDSFEFGGELMLESTWSRHVKIPCVTIPVAGPLVLQFSTVPYIELALKAGGTLDASCATQISAGVRSMPLFPFMPEGSSNPAGEANLEYSFSEVEGSAALNIMSGEISLGIPLFVSQYESVGGGTILNAELKKPDAQSQMEANKESIHECDACVDGDWDLFLRADVGIVLDWIARNNKGQDNTAMPEDGIPVTFGDSNSFKISDLSWNIITATMDFPWEPYDDFYVSFREGLDVDCGTGECPHYRYRTDVSVIDQNEVSIPDAEVKALYADQRMEEKTADSDGKVVFYLPAGENLLTGNASGMTGKEQVVIEKEPIDAELVLEGSGDFHIIFADEESDPIIDDGDTNFWPEAYDQLQQMYPDAVWHMGGGVEELIHNQEVTAGDMVLVVTYDAPHTFYDSWYDDDLSDGQDDSNIWGESCGWIFVEGRRIYHDEEENLYDHQYFSLSISYNGAYKAWLASAKPVDANAFEIRSAFDISPQYEEDYLLVGYGLEEGGETWIESREYVQVPYTTDVASIRAIPAQRSRIAGYLIELAPYVQAMKDKLDLEQRLPLME